MRQCRQEATSTPSKLNCFHDLRRPSLPATGCSDWPRGHFDRDPPSAKWRLPTVKICVFLGKFDPFRQLQLAGGGGGKNENMLDFRAFLAFRQFHSLAGMGHAGAPFPMPEGGVTQAQRDECPQLQM